MNNRIIGFLVLLLFVDKLSGQPQQRYHDLRPGDQMVDYTFKNLINYPTSTAKVSDFKDKLLILDFWSTGCASCIGLWPKVLKLQEEFKGKVQFLLMNPWESEEVVRKTFARRKELAGVDMILPASHSDKTLLEMFTISGLPEIVWIYKGQVMARTITQLTTKNIQDVLDGKKVDMPQKLGEVSVRFNPKKPLFFGNNMGDAGDEKINVLWESIFTRNSNRLNSNFDWHCSFDRGYSITLTNVDIRFMYQIAYGKVMYNEWDGYEASLERLTTNQVILEMASKERYDGKRNGQTDLSSSFIYHLFAPPTTPEKLFQRMQTDLVQYTGLTATREKRKIKCLVLSAVDTLLASYKGGEKIERLGFKADYEFDVNKILTGRLLERIRSKEYPMLDETGMKGYIGGIHEKNVNPDNPVDVNRALSKHGLRYALEERMVEVLVLREPAGYISLFELKAAIAGMSKPKNLQPLQGSSPTSWQIKFDPIPGAFRYRFEYKWEDESEWNVRFARINYSWLHNMKPGKYKFRVAGIPKFDELTTDINDLSKLNYSDELELVIK